MALLCLLFHLDPRRTPLTRAWVLTGVWCVAAVVLFVALPPIAAEVVLLAMLGTALIADERSGGRLLGQFATLGWIGALGGALVMWWIAPFYKKLDYTNDMGWEKLTQYRQNLFGFLVDKPPSGASVFAIAFGLALVAAAWSIGTLLLALWRAMRTQRGGWHGPAAAFCGALGLLVGFGLLIANWLVLQGLQLAGLYLPLGDDAVLPMQINSFTAGVGIGFVSVVYPSMMADAADEHELLFKNRREGLYFAGLGLANNAGRSIGVMMAGFALDLISFPKGLSPDDVAVLPGSAQSQLVLIWGPLPAIVAITSMVVFARYRITRARHRDISIALGRVI